MPRTLLIYGAALFLLPLGSPATADPVIITQANAISGGVTPGDTPGFPVTISLPGSYRLGSNLDVTAGRNGIEVTNFNVSIDLDGFALNGGNAAPNRALNGIVATGVETAIFSVRNGTIMTFTKSGIDAGTVSFGAFDKLQVIANGGDGISAENYVLVTNSIISGNVGWGVSCGWRCSVQSSVIADNAKGGIALTTGNVLGNTIENNSGGGIIASLRAGAGNNTLDYNGFGKTQTRNVAPLQPNYCYPTCQYGPLQDRSDNNGR